MTIRKSFRPLAALVAVVAALCSAWPPTGVAQAQQANVPPAQQTDAGAASRTAHSKACVGRTDVIGVSRVVEIDTAGGQLFGQQQYKDNDFLADGEVVLTFDDGPLRRYTVPVLQALDAHCTKATFFVVGRMAIADPDLVRETARRGHTIGTHTWSHRNQRTLGQSAARGEVELAISSVRKTAGQPTAPFFRFPYLADSRYMTQHLKSRDTGIFSIDVDSRDFRTKNPADVHRTILNQLAQRRKGILLFHDIQPSTAGALNALLVELKARGFKVVHMISKTPATTLPEYDAIAERELQRKMLAASRSPLANRAIVWPIAPGEPTSPGGTVAPVAAKPPAPSSLGPSSASAPSPLAAQPAVLEPPPEAQAPPTRKRWMTEEDQSWQSRVFQN